MKKTRRFSCTLLSLLMLFTLLLPISTQKAQASDYTETQIGREDHAFVYVDTTGWAAAPSINADTAIVIELNSGAVLYSKNPNQRMYPASLTKIMTTLVVIEQAKDLNAMLTLSNKSVTDLEDGGEDSQHRFYEGQKFTIEEGLYALCLDSVNTVGYALAEYMDGGFSGFAKRMNARAKEAGALTTNFCNPHGLNDKDHMTSAYDLAKILWDASENDTYRRIAGAKNYNFTDAAGHNISCKHNLQHMQPASEFYDSRVICGKTGFTTPAGYTRALYASDGKLDIIIVTMHSSTTVAAYQDVQKLLNYSFDNFQLAKNLPEFGTKGVLNTTLTINGKEEEVTFTAGDAVTNTGSKVLLPKVAGQTWDMNLVLSEGSLKAVYSINGNEYLYYPLTMSMKEQSAPETKPSVPEKTTEKTTASSTTQSTISVPGPTVPGDQNPEAQTSTGMKLLLILLVIALLVAVTVIIILAQNVRGLRRLLARRRRSREVEKNG